MLSLSDVKDHLRVETNDDDALLATYLAAASARVQSFTGVDLSEVGDHSAELGLAVFMLVGAWYENREAALADAPEIVPYGFDDLLLNHREWSF